MGKEISRRKFFGLVFPSVGAVIGVGVAERLGILKTLELLTEKDRQQLLDSEKPSSDELPPAPESVEQLELEIPPQVEEVQIQEVALQPEIQPETLLQPEVSFRLERNQLAVYKRLEDLPGFMDKREEVSASVGLPETRSEPIDSLIWHWTWTDRTGGDGTEIVRIKSVPLYHFCILPQNVDGVFAKFQYLVDINRIAYHAEKANDTAIGISYIGKAPPTDQQIRTRRLLTLWLMENLGISAENVKVHREVGATKDIAGVRGLTVNDPRWKEAVNWERRKLASIQRGLHLERWAQKDQNDKWIIPPLLDNALSVQEAAVVAQMVAENWDIPFDEVFGPLISSESNFRHWEIDGRIVMDYTGDGGTGTGQIVFRWHPEVDQQQAIGNAAYNLDQSAQILLGKSGGWEEKVSHYKGDVPKFLEIYKGIRDTFPPVDGETGLRQWRLQLPKPKVYERASADRKVIALTFDGGWPDRQGEDALRILRELNVQSTMFLTGHYIQTGSDLVKEMLRNGHEIGNHSFTHPNFTDLDESEIESELTKTAQAYQFLTGEKMSLWFRFPAGSSNQDAVKAVYDNGYQAVQWSLASRDWENIPSEQIFNDIVGKVHPGAIVVLHLGGKNTAAALEKIIPELRGRDYKLVTLSEMFMRSKPGVEPEIKERRRRSEVLSAGWMPQTVLRWTSEINEVANQYRVDPNLVAAIILYKSGGNFCEVCPGGAFGLMQVMPFNAKGLNPFSPKDNLLVGSRYLADQYNQFGRWNEAIMAYDCGPEEVKKGAIPQRSRDFLKWVKGMWNEADKEKSSTFQEWLKTEDGSLVEEATQFYENETRLKVVELATQQLGEPYLWGGQGPDQWDCSGLVLGAYREAGISLPDEATKQWNQSGRRLAMGEEHLPGDLVFFTLDGVTSDHVGMIIDPPSVFIEASGAANKVRVSSLDSESALYREKLAKRVLGFKRIG